MSFTDLFCLFTVAALAITYRPGAGGGAWEYVLLLSAIITCGILVCRIGAIVIPQFRKGS